MNTVKAKNSPLRINPSKIYVSDVIICGIILLVIFRGFIDNFIGNGTLLVDALFLCLLIWAIGALLRGEVSGSRHKKLLKLYLAWCLLCLIVGFMQVVTGRTGLYDAVIGFRNNNIYTGLFFIAALRLDKKSVKRYYNLFINCGVAICLFAIFQFLLRDLLPIELLVLKGEDIFELFNSDIIRVTGLMGNTIIFGGFAIVLFSLIWAELNVLNYRSVRLWLKLVIVAISNFLTFSRASVFGMVAVFVLEFLIYGCARRRAIEYILATLAMLVAVFVLAITVFRDTVIVQRILGLNSSWVSGSDAGHYEMIDVATDMIMQNWLIGTLMGQSNRIITDGSIWAYILEMGIPVFILYCILICFLVATAFKKLSKRNNIANTLSLGYIGMISYFVVFSFINSAYASRSVLTFVWLIAGMLLSNTEKGDNSAKN